VVGDVFRVEGFSPRVGLPRGSGSSCPAGVASSTFSC
jgi:hypothetical protein